MAAISNHGFRDEVNEIKVIHFFDSKTDALLASSFSSLPSLGWQVAIRRRRYHRFFFNP